MLRATAADIMTDVLTHSLGRGNRRSDPPDERRPHDVPELETGGRRLEGAHRVIGFDFRGMLMSPGTPHAVLEGHVDDVLALLDYLGVTRVHAVGTSFGALIGAMLAARHPVRVRSLALITPPSV